MLKKILLLCLMTVSLLVSAQYSIVRPVTNLSPSGVGGIQSFNYAGNVPIAISGRTNATYGTSPPCVFYTSTIFTIVMTKVTSLNLSGFTTNKLFSTNDNIAGNNELQGNIRWTCNNKQEKVYNNF